MDTASVCSLYDESSFSYILPFGAGSIGLLKRPSEKTSATRVVHGIMITLAVLLILVDRYVVSLALSQMLYMNKVSVPIAYFSFLHSGGSTCD
jgi:hypothetical protein